MNLCIIILGLIRTFFYKGYNSLKPVLEKCLEKYQKIHIILIVSSRYDENRIKQFIEDMNIIKISVELHEFQQHYIDKEHFAKIKTEKYIQKKEEYLNQNNSAKIEIGDPEYYIFSGTYQFYQLRQGIQEMKKYEEKNEILFDICMKTRFDIEYPKEFYPFIHDKDCSFIDKIYLNQENKSYFENRIENIDKHIHILKENPIELPDCRTSYHSFGGAYFNNYISLENIKNGSNNILYMYNDYIIFGNREQFIKLEGFFSEYGIMDTSLNIYHYYAQEAQILIYCFNHDINPIMYKHNTFQIMYY
jgi:hypothetical protein